MTQPSAMDVAKYIIQKEKNLTIMRLLKLQYIAYGFSLVLHSESLFANARFEAWPYGPVDPNIYKQFKHNKKSNIDTSRIEHKTIDLSEEKQDLVDEILEIYESKEGWDWSIVTHEADSPWTQTVEEKGFYSEIPKEWIQSYYDKFVA